jgi:Rhodopirellula transposase DDE domain
VHDFPDPELGKAIPYGVYDLGADAGWVSVGTDHDTAAFAVATIRRWWEQARPGAGPQGDPPAGDRGRRGQQRLPGPGVEDAAGRLAAETGLQVTVCQFPPGTSKWNKVEHGCSATSPSTGEVGRWSPMR